MRPGESIGISTKSIATIGNSAERIQRLAFR